MKRNKLRVFAGMLLIFSMLISNMQISLAHGDGESKSGETDAFLPTHKKEMIGFNEDWEPQGENISVIVEFVHNPAGVEAALSREESQHFALYTSDFDYVEAEEKALEDHQQFLEGLANLLGRRRSAVGINYEYHVVLNGVALVVPDTYINEILALDCVKAIYLDETTTVEEVIQADEEETGPEVPEKYKDIPDDDNEIEPEEESPKDEEIENPEITPEDQQGDNLPEEPDVKPLEINDRIKGMAKSHEFYNMEEVYEKAGEDLEIIQIAILDSGIDYNHPDFIDVFATETPKGEGGGLLKNGYFYGRNYLHKDSGEEAKNDNEKNDPMDDHSHGSHVAGIITGQALKGNGGTMGIAQNVQIASYKVLDRDNKVTLSRYLAGLEGAVKDGYKMIQSSIGWNTQYGPDHATTRAVNNACLADPMLIFVSSAGNGGPGSQTLSSPGTSPFAFSAANAELPEENTRLTILSKNGESDIIYVRGDWFTSVVGPDEENHYFLEGGKFKLNEDQSYNMVLIPSKNDSNIMGTCTQEDVDAFVNNADNKAKLDGALVVMRRGQSFDKTVDILKKYNAAAILIINNGNDYAGISYFQGPFVNYIPTFTMQTEIGDAMIEGMVPGEVYNFTITGTNRDSFEEGWRIYSGSSRGSVMLSGDLKPDITAIGTSVISTIPKSDAKDYEFAYGMKTGTSMAAPHISGFVAILRGVNPDLTRAQVRAILMNTADILEDESVFAMGAGMVNPIKALDADVYAVSDVTRMYLSDTSKYDGVQKTEAGSVSFGEVAIDAVKGYSTSKQIKVYSLEDAHDLQVEIHTSFNSHTGITFESSEEAISVDAKGTAVFDLSVKVAKDTPVGSVGEGYLALKEGNEIVIRMPFAISVRDSSLETLNMKKTFLENIVVSNGKYSHLSSAGQAKFNSSDTILHMNIVSDYILLEFDKIQIYFADGTGELIGQISPSPWKNIADYVGQWYFYNYNLSSCYKFEYDENHNIIGIAKNKEPLSEGHYKLVIRTYKEGQEEEQHKDYTIDFYVDNTLPELKLENASKDMWQYKRIGQEAEFRGNIYDKGTEEMINLGIGGGIDKRVYDRDISQKDNFLYVQLKNDYYRAEIEEDGNFKVLIPLNKLAEGEMSAKLWFGDHLQTVGFEDTEGIKYVECFSPSRDTLSYYKPVGSTYNDVVPYMQHYAQKAANISSRDVILKSMPYAAVRFESNGGTLIEDLSLLLGEKLQEPPKPVKSGYEFLGWFTDQECTIKWDFVSNIVAKDITLYASWKAISTSTPNSDPVRRSGTKKSTSSSLQDAAEESIVEKGTVPLGQAPLTAGSRSFTDVPSDSWYYNAVYFGMDKGIFSGYSDTLFGATDNMTRGQFVTTLGRLAESMGVQISDVNSSFTDVPAGQWYTKYVAWGEASGIIKGHNTTVFGLNDYITREQMVSIFVRFAAHMNIELDAENSQLSFADSDQISRWAYEDVMKAAKAGLVQGSGGTFNPTAYTLRCEVAQVFMKFIEGYIDR